MNNSSINSAMEGGLSLSLISQFCDAKLKEISDKCSNEQISNSHRTSLYSDVLSSASSSAVISYNTNKQGEREITVQSYHSGPGGSGSSNTSNSSNPSAADYSNPAAQGLVIKRKLNVSKHIKPTSIREWVDNEATGVKFPKNDGCEFGRTEGSERESNSLARERLESYLPILKERVKDSVWGKLESVPELKSLFVNSHENGTSTGSESGSQNSQQSKWDMEQGFLLKATDDQMVYYGMIEKAHSVKFKCLKRHFDCIGVQSLPLHSMTENKKQLYLADGTAKICVNDLSGQLRYSDVVSGVVVAVIGRYTTAGMYLLVEDVIFPTPCPPEWPLPGKNNVEMVFVSGINLGNESGSTMALDLLQDYLLGLSGSMFEQSEVLASRTRLFLVGNMITKSVRGKSNTSVENYTGNLTRAMEKLDRFLEPLLEIMEVFLIPGENDVTLTSSLPQPPILPKSLPESGRYPTLHRLTNPARIEVSVTKPEESSSLPQYPLLDFSMMESSYAEFLREDVHFIDMTFQSGKNIKETMEYCETGCPIEMGIQLLKWGHLHPTYCDSNSALAQNLFRLKGSLPHVVAIGNLTEFKTVSWNNTQVIGIPTFYNSHTAVVLTKDFNVVPITFKML